MARKAPRELRSFALRARQRVSARLVWDGEGTPPQPFFLFYGDRRGVIEREVMLGWDRKSPERLEVLRAVAAMRPPFLAVSLVIAYGGEELRAEAIERVVRDGDTPTIGEVYERGIGGPAIGLLSLDSTGAAMLRAARVVALADGRPDWGGGQFIGMPWVHEVQQAMADRARVPPLDTGA